MLKIFLSLCSLTLSCAALAGPSWGAPTLGLSGIQLGADWAETKTVAGVKDVRCERVSGMEGLRRGPTLGCSFEMASPDTFVGKPLAASMFALIREGRVIGLISEMGLEGPSKGAEFAMWAAKVSSTLRLDVVRENSVALLSVPSAVAAEYSQEKLLLSPAIYARFNPTTTEVNLVIGSFEIVRYFKEMTTP